MRREAAEEAAGFEAALADLRADMKLIKWMLETNTAIVLGIVWLVLRSAM